MSLRICYLFISLFAFGFNAHASDLGYSQNILYGQDQHQQFLEALENPQVQQGLRQLEIPVDEARQRILAMDNQQLQSRLDGVQERIGGALDTTTLLLLIIVLILVF